MAQTNVVKGGVKTSNLQLKRERYVRIWCFDQPENHIYYFCSIDTMFKLYGCRRRPILESAIVLLVVVHMVVRSVDVDVVVLLPLQVDIPS